MAPGERTTATSPSTDPRGSLRVALPIALVVLASVGLVFGLGALASGGDTTAGPTVDENVSAQLATLDGFVATRETVIDRANGTTRTVERVSHRPGTGVTRALVRSGPGETDVRVSNGSVLWLYDRETNTATRIRLGERASRGSRVPDRVQRLFVTRRHGPTGPAVSDRPRRSTSGHSTWGDGVFTVRPTDAGLAWRRAPGHRR